MHPILNFAETITAAARGGEEHEQAKDRPDGGIDAVIVEDVIFDHHSPRRLDIFCQLANERLILLVIFTVNDV